MNRLVCVAFVLWMVQVYCAERPVVNTALGEIKGTREDVLGTTVDAYLGVPFAKPPVGDRRFRRPEAVEPWSGTYDASSLPRPCAQPKAEEFMTQFENEIYMLDSENPSEDCLYLNVWTPQNADKVAVMVWIHGGGFMSGSTATSLYNGRYLSASEDVIIVSIQYRLGFFGFFFMDDEEAPGNMGLLDQHLAIKWVYDNVESFGGDKERITIFGESAGGASVVIQMLTDLPQYFKNAIVQSTPSLVPFCYSPPESALELYKGISERLGCTEDDMEVKMACLRELDHKHIMEVLAHQFGYAMTLDNNFIRKPPQENFGLTKANVLIGSNENEGYLLFWFFKHSEMTDQNVKPQLNDREYIELLGNVSFLIPSLKDEAVKRIEMAYRKDYPNNVEAFDAIVGDVMFTCGANEIADNLAATSNVHMYRLKYRSPACLWPEWNGVGHACDIDLMFGAPLNPANQHIYQASDTEVSKTMMKHWSNFAKTGNPNVDDKGNSVKFQWPKYTLPDRKYMIYNSPELSIGEKLNEKRCTFLDKVFKEEENRQRKNDRTEL